MPVNLDEFKHARHEHCTVPYAGSVHGPCVDIVQKGTYYNITQCPVHGESHIWVLVQAVNIISVVIDSQVEPLQTAKLNLWKKSQLLK